MPLFFKMKIKNKILITFIFFAFSQSNFAIGGSEVLTRRQEFHQVLSNSPKSQWFKLVHDYFVQDPEFLSIKERKKLAEAIAKDEQAMLVLSEYQQMHYMVNLPEAWWFFLAQLEDPNTEAQREAINALNWTEFRNQHQEVIKEVARTVIKKMKGDLSHAHSYVIPQVVLQLRLMASQGSQEAEEMLAEGAQALLKQFSFLEGKKEINDYPSAGAGYFVSGLKGQQLSDAVNVLINKTGSQVRWVRGSAQLSLSGAIQASQGELLDKIVQHVLGMLKSDEKETWSRACDILAHLKSSPNESLMSDVVQALIVKLDDVPWMQMKAARSLGYIASLIPETIQEHLVQVLVKKSGETYHETRQYIVWTLSELAPSLNDKISKEVFTFLLKLEDPDQLTHQYAAQGLARIVSKMKETNLETIVIPLIDILHHENEYVRGQATLIFKEHIMDRINNEQIDAAIEGIEKAKKLRNGGWIEDNLEIILKRLKSRKGG